MQQPIDSDRAVLGHPNMHVTRLCKPLLLRATPSVNSRQLCSNRLLCLIKFADDEQVHWYMPRCRWLSHTASRQTRKGSSSQSLAIIYEAKYKVYNSNIFNEHSAFKSLSFPSYVLACSSLS
jgi:hypothetical protein